MAKKCCPTQVGPPMAITITKKCWTIKNVVLPRAIKNVGPPMAMTITKNVGQKNVILPRAIKNVGPPMAITITKKMLDNKKMFFYPGKSLLQTLSRPPPHPWPEFSLLL